MSDLPKFGETGVSGTRHVNPESKSMQTQTQKVKCRHQKTQTQTRKNERHRKNKKGPRNLAERPEQIPTRAETKAALKENGVIHTVHTVQQEPLVPKGTDSSEAEKGSPPEECQRSPQKGGKKEVRREGRDTKTSRKKSTDQKCSSAKQEKSSRKRLR